jgi:hypothetical protein
MKLFFLYKNFIYETILVCYKKDREIYEQKEKKKREKKKKRSSCISSFFFLFLLTV